MSFQDRPSYQRPTKSSSSPSVTPVRRVPGNVPLVRGLSPVRSPYYGRAQEIETQRSHDNPLFRSYASDAGEKRSGRAVLDSSYSQTMKSSKENGETEEPWKVHVERGQFGGKSGGTTPGKTSRVATMQFTTPPKPVVKRKILSDSNRDVGRSVTSSTPRRGEGSFIATVSTSRVDVASTGSHEIPRDEIEKRSSELRIDESDDRQAPMVSIEELQKRIQKFLQTDSPTEAPVSPVQCAESTRRFSGVVCGGSPEPSVEDVVASYHPVFSPYSPRPEFLRARTRSPSPVATEAEDEESLIHDQSPVPGLEKSTTPTSYDPKNNFLSPRPQFLRYRPLRRLELLRRSADALLDLDLDSPATDSPADSVKVESEIGANESEEIQSVASEVFALPARVAEERVEECNSESRPVQVYEGQSAESELKTESLSEDSVLTSEIRSEISVDDRSQVDSTGAKSHMIEHSDGELDAEVLESPEVEEVRSLPSRILRYSVCLFGIVGLVLLILAASGSPGILPQSLHQNELSALWRTNEHTVSVRKFLQSVEGLWREVPGVLVYPVNQHYMETLETNLAEVRKAVVNFDSQVAFAAMMELYSISASYVAPFSSHAARTYSNVRKWLFDAADSYISRAPDIDEWVWVPEYDFVVAKDIFDWAEAYENILAKVDSWEVKSIFQSHIDSNGAKSIHELIQESSLKEDLELVKSITSEARYASNMPAMVMESPNNQFTQAPHEEPASGEPEEQVLLESLDLDNKAEFFGSSSLALGGTKENTAVVSPFETQDVEPPTVILNQDGVSASSGGDLEVSHSSRTYDHEDVQATSLSSTERGVHMIVPFHTVEHVSVEDIQNIPEQLSQEGTSGGEIGNSNLVPIQDASEPQDMSSQESFSEEMTVAGIEPKISGFSMLPRFKLAMSPTVLAVSVTSVLLAAVVAMILLRPARRSTSQVLRSSKDDGRTGNSSIDVNNAQVGKAKLPRKPQRTFKIATTSHAVDSGSNYLPGEYPVPTKLSSEIREHIATPTLSSERAQSKPANDRTSFLSPERVVKPVTDRNSFLSPERSFKQVSDKDSFLTPEIEVLEDSSLGRFTALVPVVHNEGTEKEEVKLTPVRRSSRIRSRLQSPCSSTFSHYSYSP